MWKLLTYFTTFSMCIVYFTSLVIFLYRLLIGGFFIKLLFGTFFIKLLFGMLFYRVIALNWENCNTIVVFSFEAEFIQRLLQYTGNILPESLIISCHCPELSHSWSVLYPFWFAIFQNLIGCEPCGVKRFYAERYSYLSVLQVTFQKVTDDHWFPFIVVSILSFFPRL